jgi:hypothetical protein
MMDRQLNKGSSMVLITERPLPGHQRLRRDSLFLDPAVELYGMNTCSRLYPNSFCKPTRDNSPDGVEAGKAC